MTTLSDHINELKAAEAFTLQAPVFDSLFGNDPIICYKRERVRAHILSVIKGKKLLEINCGSGEDALYFSGMGFTVHATDISEGMLQVFRDKMLPGNKGRVTMELRSFTDLGNLENRGPYDAVYSNFGGLNCTRDPAAVLQPLSSLVKAGGTVTLVVISPFCAWESLLLFKGKFRTAFRRFFAAHGRKAKVEGSAFRCWYHKPAALKKIMQNDFEPLSFEGLCTLVPPSYMVGFAGKYPRLFAFLCSLENKWKSFRPWRSSGDYYIISFRKKLN